MPGDRRNNPPPSPHRRRLLIAAGYAAASGIALTTIGRATDSTDRRRGAGGSGRKSSGGTPLDDPPVPPALEGAAAQPPPDHIYDLVISGGRVMDPATGFDHVAHVGVDGGTITGISLDPLAGRTGIDAKGKVVAPGFIDCLSYEPNDRGARFKLEDGVTTNLGMHGMQESGVWIDTFLATYQGQCRVNFGGAFSDHWVRANKFGLGVDATASPSQISALAETLEEELLKGWLGVDFEPEYTPGVNGDEIRALATVAKRYEVPCYFHGRYSSHADEAKTVPEIIQVAKDTGASVHIAHLPSTGGTWDIDTALKEIHTARDQGYDVTACMYPYDYWATFLGSARFNDGWQERFQISYEDLQIANTPNRLDAAGFNRGRDQQNSPLCVAYAIPEQTVRTAMADPIVMIGSDAIIDSGNNHPRATGCFSRVLGKFVRDEKVLSLMDGLAKMTIQPAERVGKRAPAMQRKGRLQRGADADITVFDPATISDRSSVADTMVASTGVAWVLVGGTVAKNPDGVVEDAVAGQPVLSELR